MSQSSSLHVDPPSPQTLELLLKKLTRRRMKLERLKELRDDSLSHLEATQAGFYIAEAREEIAQLEVLLWLARQAKQAEAALEQVEGVMSRLASPTTKPNPAPPSAPPPSKPDADT